MNHPLHLEIGTFLQQLVLPADCKLLLAPECGGSHNLPLFCSDEKSNDTEYCNLDALVVKDGKIRFLLEIEESGLTPARVCGKFLTSALSTHFIHDVLNGAASAMDGEVTFVQVMDAKNLRSGTKKITQGQALQRSIQSILPVRQGSITVYRLFFFRGLEEFQSNQAAQRDFQQVFLTACGGQSATIAPVTARQPLQPAGAAMATSQSSC
jgi:hypothetical protein